MKKERNKDRKTERQKGRKIKVYETKGRERN